MTRAVANSTSGSGVRRRRRSMPFWRQATSENATPNAALWAIAIASSPGHEQVDVVERLRLDALGARARTAGLALRRAQVEAVDDAAHDADHDRRLDLRGRGVDEARAACRRAARPRGLVAVAHALERVRLVGLRLELDRVGALERLAQRARCRRRRPSAATTPPPPKISPNSTMNMIGNANVKKNAGRSRPNMRTLAPTTGCRRGGGSFAELRPGRVEEDVLERRLAHRRGRASRRSRASASATRPSSVRCGSIDVSS